MGSPERKSVTERVAEFSKKVDYVVIAVGSGIYVLFNQPVGMALIIGSVLTVIPAKMLENWARRRRLSQASA